MTTTPTTNAGERRVFETLRAGGLDLESASMRLFHKGAKSAWVAGSHDLSQDRDHLAFMPAPQILALQILVAMFTAGEESVAADIRPFQSAMAAEHRLDDELYLAQFAYEEARHTIAFRGWLDAVGWRDDLHTTLAGNGDYHAIFSVRLPQTLMKLSHGGSPEDQIRASIVYNHMVEGVLALTGYFAVGTITSQTGRLPGLAAIIADISNDERRHLAWGTGLCRRLLAEDPALGASAREEFALCRPRVEGALAWVFDTAFGDAGTPSQRAVLGFANVRARRRERAVFAHSHPSPAD